jgi:hypothetical protein
MRKSLAIAALVAVGGTAAGAGAVQSLLGSDTLFVVTTTAISNCTIGMASTALSYAGTGSGNGENAMIAGTQGIAPMSRFLAGNLCTGVTVAKLQTSNGIVIGLDGVAVVSSLTSGGPCNGTNSTTCALEAVGAAYSTSVTVGANTYTFNNWKDVLSLVYGGKTHSGWTALAGADNGCGSTTRKTVVNGWGNLFQVGSTCGTAGSDGCTQLQHAFRRDDASGTSDVFASLIGLSPAPTQASNFGFGTSPFCNVNMSPIASTTAANPIAITTSLQHGLTSGQTVQVVGVGVDIAGNPIASGNGAANGVWSVTVTSSTSFTIPADGTIAGNGNKVGSYAMVLLPPPAGLLADFVPTSMRDLDPIRRPCANNGSPTLNLEDVCGRDNNLGLVVPIVPTDFLGGLANQFPSTACSGGTNHAVRAPTYTDPIQNLAVLGQCPNGDKPHGGNLCVFPATGGTNTQCLSGPSDKPFVYNAPAGLTPAPGQVLGTVFNNHLMNATHSYQKDTFNNFIVGAFYRIHQADAIAGSGATIAAGANINGGAGPAPVAPGFCQRVDATELMGCLVQASPCSIGYAGKEALAWNGASSANNVGLKVNQVLPLSACIQTFNYNLSRKLYLNSIPGFAAANAAENGLAQCESDTTRTGNGNIQNILAANNFVNFAAGSAPNSGNPFAEDYNETMLCPTQVPPATTANVNAFTGNVAPIPSTGTICGNGIRENYEDCDDGTPSAAGPAPASYVPNGTAPAPNGGNGSGTSQCTNTCRWTGAVILPDPAGTKDVGGATCTATTDNGVNCHTTATPPAGSLASTAGKCQTTAGVGGCLP